MDTSFKIRPQHKVCEKNVGVPTLLVEPLNQGGDPQLFVQWFGEAQGMNLAEMQFRFPVSLSSDNDHWMGHPELFKVVLLGQIKDWPKKEAMQAIADSVGKGSVEAWILWVTSSYYTTGRGQEIGPATFAIHMNVMLADATCGIITPRKYCDVSVLSREMELVNQRFEM